MNELLQRMLDSQFDQAEDFDLLTRALRLQIGYHQDPFAANASARVVPKPHQVYVAHKAVGTWLYPRMLLADDVGLGKTIEAGLIIKALKLRGLVRRTLVVTPASLTTQWESELRKKFNEPFAIFNTAREREYQAEVGDRNIWLDHNQVICSLDFATSPVRSERLIDAGWDMVIFDEAHHVRRTQVSQERDDARLAYRFADRLKDRTRGLLLLTATPMQLDAYEFWSLLALLDPGLFPTYADFTRHRDERRRCNELLGKLELGARLSPQEQMELQARSGGQLVTFASAVADLSRHDPLSEVMVRNRKAKLGKFAERSPQVLQVKMSPAEREVYAAMKAYLQRGYADSQVRKDYAMQLLMVSFQRLLTSSPAALVSALNKRLNKLRQKEVAMQPAAEPPSEDTNPEELFEEVCGHWGVGSGDEVQALTELRNRVLNLHTDAKLQALVARLQQLLADPTQKVLIFTQFTSTLEYLRKELERRHTVATFHGGMSVWEKDAQTEIFRTRAQIMIATEAGGEGRNFQFCNVIVNYDLPWNPMKIEQRIGRVDRIGQKANTVYIYNFSIAETIESRVLDVLQNRIRIFEETVGGLDPILGHVEDDLNRFLLSRSSDAVARLDQYGEEMERRVTEARAVEVRQSDRLMDFASFHPDTFEQFLHRVKGYTPEEIDQFLEGYFGRWGTATRLAAGVLQVEPPGIFAERHPRLYDFVHHVGTCNTELASQREDVEFFAIGHPLVDAALSEALRPEFPGLVTARRCYVPGVHGRFMLQCNLLITYTGVRQSSALVPICIDLETLDYDEELSRQVAAAPSQSAPNLTISSEWATQLRRAWQALEEAAPEFACHGLDSINEQNRRGYDLERRRLERQVQAQRCLADQERARIKEDIERISLFGTAGQRQILHVWRTNLAKVESRLREAESEFDKAAARLETLKSVNVSQAIHSAAFVWIP